MKRTLLAILMACVILCGTVMGAEANSSHDQAVADLMKTMNMEEQMMGGATAMVDAMIQGDASIAPYRDILLQWAKKYLTWDAVAPQLVKVYKETFTEAELREIIAFYRTPTGTKALRRMPELTQKGALIGASVAQAHSAELQKMILDRKKEIEGTGQKP